MLEGILITDLQCADIHRYRIVILDCLQQIIGNTAGCIGEVRRLGILIQILHPLRHTAAYALGDLHLGRIFHFDLIVFLLQRLRQLLRLIGFCRFHIFRTFTGINTRDPHFFQRINMEVLQSGSSGDQYTTRTVYDRLIDHHSRLHNAQRHIFSLDHRSLPLSG